MTSKRSQRTLLLLAAYAVVSAPTAADDTQASGIPTPTGKTITPTAARGAIFRDLNPGHPSAPDQRANHAVALSVSPDGRMLAILTSGSNRRFGKDGKLIPELSTEYVFLFDISGSQPRQTQVLTAPNTFQGLAWAPSSNRLFVSGGKNDTILEFTANNSRFTATRTFRLAHKTGIGLDVGPMAGSVAVSPDGTRLLATNFQNDSVSLIDLRSGQVVTEQDLRPGLIDAKRRGRPGGSFPRCVVWVSPNRAYVGSERDREIISLTVAAARIRVMRRIPVNGQPVALLANRHGSRLYAALDNTDKVAILDTTRDTLIEEFNAVAPESIYPNAQKLGGANSDALALTPDESLLLVSNGGANAIAVVRLSNCARALPIRRHTTKDDDGDDEPRELSRSSVIGLTPTGWYPTGVATSKDGSTWYVVNAKSETGPNASWCGKLNLSKKTCIAENPPGPHYGDDPYFAENGQVMLRAQAQTTYQMERAGFLTFPVPSELELARLTKQVARNNHFDQLAKDSKDEALFSFLREHIKHVIYIVKENRTYDQILGDLEVGNGDPRLAIFPRSVSPNHHAIARNFSTLDNFLVSGEGSWTGWQWSVAARTSDFAERGDPLGLSDRGDLDAFWGSNRNIVMGLATSDERHAQYTASPTDPDVLPGVRDVAELDGPGGEKGKGYIWDAVLRRGMTVRNYGFYGDWLPAWSPLRAPMVRDPFTQNLQVFFPANISLKPYSDLYYHVFNPAFPDYWRYREWKREFDAFSESKALPNLVLVQLGNDHLGAFGEAIDGVNTPETQMADNDYALGLITEAVANSPFANDTLIVSVEDDTWDGPDHVNSFRSVALVAGPYVRQRAVVSTRYNTVSLVKTIEEILGVGPIGLNDALAAPMSDVFDVNSSAWTYNAIVPDVLRSTKLPLPPADHTSNAVPKHSAAYWTKAMAGQDFSRPDRINPITFNGALWRGMKGNAQYPTQTGLDLHANRERLLRSVKFQEDKKHRRLLDVSF